MALDSLLAALTDLGWPLALALAWGVGELGHRLTGLPRIALYGLVGFALGPGQLGWLGAQAGGTGVLLSNVAFGLILFEFGYRINLRWLRINPWLAASGALEALATLAAVFALARGFGAPLLTALLLAALAMSSSPAALLRVVNEGRCSGQVTERALHLAAIDCVLAVFVFKVVLGFWTYETSGSLPQAVSNSLVVFAVSAALGAAFGAAVPALLRRLDRLSADATLAFAVAVVVLVALTHVLKLSPVLAALTFGLVARHRRVVLTATQRNFGALGDLLAIVLFVHAGSTLEAGRVADGLWLGLGLVAVRALAKVLAVALLARAGGVTVRKGVLTGAALTPMSAFVILLLEQTRHLGIDLIDHLAPLAAATLVLELLGPVVTQRALIAAGEMAGPRRKPD